MARPARSTAHAATLSPMKSLNLTHLLHHLRISVGNCLRRIPGSPYKILHGKGSNLTTLGKISKPSASSLMGEEDFIA
jgi:hypothetical protein